MRGNEIGKSDVSRGLFGRMEAMGIEKKKESDAHDISKDGSA